MQSRSLCSVSEFRSSVIIEHSDFFLSSFLEKCLTVSSGVQPCRDGGEEGLVHTISLLFYCLLYLNHVSAGLVVDSVHSDVLQMACVSMKALVL